MPATLAVGLKIPYLNPSAAGLPNKDNPLPNSAPSCPYINLFFNLAFASSSPSKFVVSISFSS